MCSPFFQIKSRLYDNCVLVLDLTIYIKTWIWHNCILYLQRYLLTFLLKHPEHDMLADKPKNSYIILQRLRLYHWHSLKCAIYVVNGSFNGIYVNFSDIQFSLIIYEKHVSYFISLPSEWVHCIILYCNILNIRWVTNSSCNKLSNELKCQCIVSSISNYVQCMV